jgi:hypothetical protein
MTSSRPKNVRRFEVLIYLAGATEAVSLALQDTDWVVVAAAIALYASLILILVRLTAYKGRNGVRWYFFGLFVKKFLDVHGLAQQEYYRDYQAAGILDFTALVLGALAFYFVFTGDAPAWFRRPGQIFY